MMQARNLLAAICLGSFIAGGASAAIDPDMARRLGTDLTPMGAELAGNGDGTIPAWNPAGTPVPDGFVADSDNYINPYAGETPLYTIDGANWREYVDVLSVGTQALFEKYGADGFRIDVYPTKREFVTPEWYYENSRKNATSANLAAEGQRVDGNLPGVPFPIPQTGLEVIWNHMIRYATDHEATFDTYYVNANGKPILSTTGQFNNVFKIFEDPAAAVEDTAWLKLRINYSAPARRAGEILLVHEPGADYTEGRGRRAWQYLTGQRRVRLAPAVSFDTPNPAVAGTSTYDDAFLFNGSPERFDWKLIGKKELIVPYSNYDFLFQTEVEDALGERFLKPEYIRWEKHRVWVVEATLKDGQRHLYSKRRFYIDEDTWAAMAADLYDGQGNLWRVQYAYSANLYDRKSIYGMAYGAYDLIQGIYNINAKPIPGKYRNGVDRNDKYFTPKGMARSGVR